MSQPLLLTIYCALIVAVSLLGGWAPMMLRLTHRRMEVALSFVSGVMLGVAMLHLLPHAIDVAGTPAGPSAEIQAGAMNDGNALAAHAHEDHGLAHEEHGLREDAQDEAHPRASGAMSVLAWTLAGLLVMFLLERFFPFHHHPEGGPAEGAEAAGGHGPCDHAPDDDDARDHGHGAARTGAEVHPHQGHVRGHYAHAQSHAAHAAELASAEAAAGERLSHRMSWGGAMIGFTVHTIVGGVALAAATEAEFMHGGAGADGSVLAGLAAFLVIFLHKPFDALTIGTLMAAGGSSRSRRHLINGIFGLMIPLGVVLYHVGAEALAGKANVLSPALGFSAGTFLCIALSDVLPELHFHKHDRVKLSLALLTGIAAAVVITVMESAAHVH